MMKKLRNPKIARPLKQDRPSGIEVTRFHLGTHESALEPNKRLMRKHK